MSVGRALLPVSVFNLPNTDGQEYTSYRQEPTLVFRVPFDFFVPFGPKS